MGKHKMIEVANGDDLSGCCIKCGSDKVAQELDVVVEWLPAWAKYIVAVDFSRLIYNKFRQEGLLRIGLCAKHAQSPIKKRIKAYGSLLAAAASMGLGLATQTPLLIVLSVALLFAFLAFIMEGTPLRAVKIDGERIWLPAKVHLKEQKIE